MSSISWLGRWCPQRCVSLCSCPCFSALLLSLSIVCFSGPAFTRIASLGSGGCVSSLVCCVALDVESWLPHVQGLPTRFPERKRLQLTQEQAQLIQAYRQHQHRLQGQAAQQPAGQLSQQQPAKKRSSKKKASKGFQMSAGLQPAT